MRFNQHQHQQKEQQQQPSMPTTWSVFWFVFIIIFLQVPRALALLYSGGQQCSTGLRTRTFQLGRQANNHVTKEKEEEKERRRTHGIIGTALYAKKKKKPSKSSISSSSGPVAGFGGTAVVGIGQGNQKGKSLTTTKQQQQILKRVERIYGGTSPEQIARATNDLIQQKIREQPHRVQMALALYQQLKRWDHHHHRQSLSQLSILQQSELDPAEIEGAKRARDKLNQIYQENDFKDKECLRISSDQDLHNLLQQFTWDASANAKAARAITGDMPVVTQKRLERACQVVADAVGDRDLCLDVGCGFGVLVPFLIRAGIPQAHIHGVDLSPEMIRYAQELHGGSPTFTACDFLSSEYTGPTPTGAVIFCSALHDLPDPMAALNKAASLLKVGGKIVVCHAQGATHVLQQWRANPVLVQPLPTADELRQLAPTLNLIVEPAPAGTVQDSNEGYLAVLEKMEEGSQPKQAVTGINQ